MPELADALLDQGSPDITAAENGLFFATFGQT